ncbi:3-beta hydroxysteroid dehydrogenase [Pseudomonas syringae]|uniref:3-beta hydroxysteroid dehydrogenase n=1 Tax=Pseudomonas syringae TaxID=317 RepID=A0A1C7Z9Z7_PSESX|nr:SDR family oxidoreductase [Pseudomonas syringae]OCR26010.1 3-beta hydroxysteroid dehydrogenase [Pseudomonas syringae]
MHVFVTGATGWVGSEVVKDLLNAGYLVTGLARSDDKAKALAATGAKVLRATLDDLDKLRRAAWMADAVIHTAFNHDFSRFAENCQQDRQVIEALENSLKGSDCPLLVTSGLSGLPRGATEAQQPNALSPRKSEAAARSLAERGIRAATVRLAPSVHGLGDHGFLPILIRLARETGVSAYIGDGQNCWSGVCRTDAAQVYRLILEQGVTSAAYHAVADEAVPFKAIAEVIGRRLGLPVESREPTHFGWFATMAGADMAVSSAHTRALLGWTPSGPDLLTDLDQPDYFTL